MFGASGLPGWICDFDVVSAPSPLKHPPITTAPLRSLLNDKEFALSYLDNETFRNRILFIHFHPYYGGLRLKLGSSERFIPRSLLDRYVEGDCHAGPSEGGGGAWRWRRRAAIRSRSGNWLPFMDKFGGPLRGAVLGSRISEGSLSV